MMNLTDGMLLYHGSFTVVSEIALKKCKPGKDFGCGFYVTSSYEQARNFVPLSITKHINQGLLSADCSMGYISVFQLHLSPDVTIHLFKEADDIAITTLLPNRLENQFCFRSAKAIQTLEFIRSDSYDTSQQST